ncbi:hypothetical protein HMI55_006971 [Coelomomyces lativittatus]|nr:hypothetical protein HMI55_006971 [Coelomomyces lativittatus]
MVMEAGKLLFVCNLIKENRKHTLQIHEPPGPLSLSLSLPSCILPNHSRLSLIIFSDDPALQVDKGILSIRIFTPDTQIERIKFEDPDITSLEEPTRIEPNKFQLPSFKKSLRLLLCMTSSSSSVSLKVVLEYNSKDIKRTVSVSESVSFMPLPMVETEFQVIGKSTFLILTMSNAFSSPLCIDDYDLELVNGKTKCIHLFPAVPSFIFIFLSSRYVDGWV